MITRPTHRGEGGTRTPLGRGAGGGGPGYTAEPGNPVCRPTNDYKDSARNSNVCFYRFCLPLLGAGATFRAAWQIPARPFDEAF